MPVISKYIPTRAARLVEIRTWHAQKGAQHQNTFGRGCAWYADPIFVTAGTIADCTQACALIDGVSAEYLLADRGYDSRRVIEKALRAGTNVVIPPRKNRKEQRDYDRYLYKLRRLVEDAFLHLKRWRGIATRYAKLTSSFVAAVQIRCIVLWVSTLI